MHFKNTNPTNVNLGAILEELLRADVRFILVGGLAAVVQGAPVTTFDVDIVYDRSNTNITNLLTVLKSIEAIYRRPDDKIIQPTADDFQRPGHRLFTTRLGPLDVLAFIEEDKLYEDLIDHTVAIEFRGRTLHVLDLEMLIQLKRTSNDPRDKQRLPLLEETLRQISRP